MPRVVVTATARDKLDRLIETHSLPADTPRRVAHSTRPLKRFPLLGKQLYGRWSGHRSIVGPWPWMVVVYAYDERSDTVTIVTVQDGRNATSATSAR